MSALKEIQQDLQSETMVSRFESAPPNIIHKNEYSFAIQHLRANDYLLSIATKDRGSLLSAMSNVAAIGLSLNPAAKEAYLVPRKGKICLDPSYMGLVKLATDTGSILWAQARIVREKDNFALHGVDERPTHEFSPFGDRGNIVGVYCVAKTHDGSYLTETMDIASVYAIRDRSEAYKANPKKTPWFTDEEEMVKKTVTKRASKMWPKSDNHAANSRLAAAVQLSNDNDEIKLAVSNPNTGDYSDAQKEFYNKLIEDSDALGMYIFQETNPQTLINNLYHSFEKGTKGRFQAIVDELYSKGASTFEDILNAYRQAKESGDQIAIDELDLNEAELELVKERA